MRYSYFYCHNSLTDLNFNIGSMLSSSSYKMIWYQPWYQCQECISPRLFSNKPVIAHCSTADVICLLFLAPNSFRLAGTHYFLTTSYTRREKILWKIWNWTQVILAIRHPLWPQDYGSQCLCVSINQVNSILHSNITFRSMKPVSV